MAASQNARAIYYTLGGVLTGLFLAALDQTIVAIGLPTILADLGGEKWYGWVGVMYLAGSTLAAPLTGRLVEIFPRRPILLSALSLFGLGSLLCGLANHFGLLLIFRFIQGSGGGALFTLAFTTLAWFFPPRQRSRWSALIGILFGTASAIGPLLGGYLTQHLGWQWLFWINLPFLLLGLYFIYRYLPEEGPFTPAPLDVGGLVRLAGWSLPLLLTFSLWNLYGTAAFLPSLGLLSVALLSLYLWIRYEARHPSPLFELRLVRVPTFRHAAVSGFLFSAIFLGGVTFLPLYLQRVLGLAPAQSGLWLLTFTLGAMVSIGLVGAWVSRSGRYKPLLLGANILLAILLAFAAVALPLTYRTWTLPAAMIGAGAALGPFQALLSVIGQNDVPLERIGSATSALQFMRQMGGTIGLAFLNTLYGLGSAEGHIARGLQWVFGGSVVLALLLGLSVAQLPGGRLRTRHLEADPTRHPLPE
ncbi:MAG: MFS transporter [Bacteroidia bacterium]|nr:MFS transporter [Bacteroidia bacterium]MDW8088507.1 MFS transporter [Bacteroidia bacterium]